MLRIEERRRHHAKISIMRGESPSLLHRRKTNSDYPLCAGRGFANCAHCGLWADFEEEQDESRVNPPLTLEELREMDREPVWTVTNGMEDSGRWELCSCETITACPLHKVLRCVTSSGEVTDYELETYGKTWLAYRRRPEEAQT